MESLLCNDIKREINDMQAFINCQMTQCPKEYARAIKFTEQLKQDIVKSKLIQTKIDFENKRIDEKTMKATTKKLLAELQSYTKKTKEQKLLAKCYVKKCSNETKNILTEYKTLQSMACDKGISHACKHAKEIDTVTKAKNINSTQMLKLTKDLVSTGNKILTILEKQQKVGNVIINSEQHQQF